MTSLIDPYVTDTSDMDAATAAFDDLPPPAKGGSDGPDTILQLYVPGENTILDFGAGTTPGIRMITDHHAHITARGPMTTLSLGAAAGDSVPSSDPGVNLYTAANKTEHIALKTTESYDGAAKLTYGNTKDETVANVWTENCFNAKTESVDGTMTQSFKSEHNLTVGKASVYKYGGPKKETISSGDFTFSVDAGNKSETVGRNWVINVTGQKQETIGNTCNTMFQAMKHDTFCGVQFAANLGIKIGMDATIAMSRTAGANIAINDSIAVARNAITASKTQVAIAGTEISLTDTVMQLDSGRTYTITSSAFQIMK